MTHADEEVLDFALTVVHGGPDPFDVRDRVLEAWRRRASRAPHDADDELPATPSRGRWPSRTLGVAAVVAAAALLVLMVADSAPPLATTDRPVDVMRAGVTERTSRLEAGDGVYNGESPLRVRFGREAEAVADPGSYLRIAAANGEARALDAGFGRWTIITRDAAVLVSTPAARLRVAPRSEVELRADLDPYDLLLQESQAELARRMHMRSIAVSITVWISVAAGTVDVAEGGVTRTLTAGSVLTLDPAVAGPAAIAGDQDPHVVAMAREVGTWDLTVTHFDGNGNAVRESRGVEVCRAGPGRASIYSETTVDIPGVESGTVEANYFLHYEPRRGRYHGTFVDSFGGAPGVLSGRSGEEGERTLEMTLASGAPFTARMHMIWISDDERKTSLEVEEDGEYHIRRQVVHRRRDAGLVGGLFQVILNVTDMQRQVEFYRDVIGLTVEDARPDGEYGAESFVRLSSDGLSIALHAGRTSPVGSDEPRLSFRVNDLDATRERLEECGVEIGAERGPAVGVRVIDLTDPEGNVVHFEQHEER